MEQRWKDLNLLLALFFSRQVKLVPSASYLSPGQAFLTWPCCCHLLSQAPDVMDVICPRCGHPLRILALLVTQWIVSGGQVTHVKIEGIFIGVATVAVIENTHAKFWRHNRIDYILLTESLGRRLALLQPMIPESFHLMALPSWIL